MSKPDEPLTLGQETISRGTWRNGKVLLLSSVLIGFVFAVFFSPVPFTHSAVEEQTAIDMFGAQLTNPSAMRGSCPRPSALPSVSAMQDILKQHGIPSSPMAKLALTQFAAMRDVSMKAQAREEFSRLDPVTQTKLKKLSRDVVVRAANLKPEEWAGVTAPMGFWDPAGFSKTGKIAVYRAAELKHGRVCMLAFLGMVVSEKFHPFFETWSDGTPFVSATASHFIPALSENFWPAFWALCAGHELLFELGNKGQRFPNDPTGIADAPAGVIGDFGFDPYGFRNDMSDAQFKEMQTKELNNGRLAMIAALGIMGQELATGKGIF